MEEDSREMTVETEDEDSFIMLEEESKVGTPWTDMLFDYWFLWLIIAVGALYLYQKSISPKIDRWIQERADKEMEARLHRNPDLLRSREEAMQRARQRMQEQHDAEAAKMAEIRRAREEKRREEMLHKNATKYRQAGYTLNDSPESRSERSVPRSDRSDYNPLMGSETGGGYRPPRRTCPGGGCG